MVPAEHTARKQSGRASAGGARQREGEWGAGGQGGGRAAAGRVALTSDLFSQSQLDKRFWEFSKLRRNTSQATFAELRAPAQITLGNLDEYAGELSTPMTGMVQPFEAAESDDSVSRR